MIGRRIRLRRQERELADLDAFHSYLSSARESASEMFEHLMHQKCMVSPEIESLPYRDRVRALQRRQRDGRRHCAPPPTGWKAKRDGVACPLRSRPNISHAPSSRGFW
jgi:hypothetical protein